MKKILLSLISLTCIMAGYAHECNNWMLSLKQGYFIPQSKLLRTMFNSCGSRGGYFVEGAVRYNLCHDLYLELNGSYFGRKGRSLVTTLTPGLCNNGCSNTCNKVYACGDKFEFKMPTVGLGLKYFYCFHECMSFFVGGGIKGFFVRINNDSLYVPCYQSKNTVGGFVHAGLLFDLCRGFFVELFADYLGAKIKCPCTDACSKQNKLNIGGFAGGLGIGYKF